MTNATQMTENLTIHLKGKDVLTETNALPLSTSGDDYPPSRPGLKTLIGVVAVLLVGAGILWWPTISAFVGL
jgi:hypothetical protein